MALKRIAEDSVISSYSPLGHRARALANCATGITMVETDTIEFLQPCPSTWHWSGLGWSCSRMYLIWRDTVEGKPFGCYYRDWLAQLAGYGTGSSIRSMMLPHTELRRPARGC